MSEPVAVKSPAVDADSLFQLTLIGGAALNTGTRTGARPVQICVYVVKTVEWRPSMQREQASCISDKVDTDVVHSKRILLAPNQTLDLTLPMMDGKDAWLIVDADFSQRMRDHGPYIFSMTEHIHSLLLMLDGSSLPQSKNQNREMALEKSNESQSTSLKPLGASQKIRNRIKSWVANPGTTQFKHEVKTAIAGELNGVEKLDPAVKGWIQNPSALQVKRQVQDQILNVLDQKPGVSK